MAKAVPHLPPFPSHTSHRPQQDFPAIFLDMNLNPGFLRFFLLLFSSYRYSLNLVCSLVGKESISQNL